MHLVGELFESDVAVAVRVLQDELRESLFEGGLGIVETLELEEIFEESAPFALGGSDGEEDEDGVVAGAGDFDAAAVEEFGDDRCGNAPVADLALGVHAGSEDGDLGGVEHAVAISYVFVLEAVPVFSGLEGPGAGAVGEEAVGRFFEEVGLAVEGIEDVLGLVEAEEPALLGGAEAVADGGHGFTEADGVPGGSRS